MHVCKCVPRIMMHVYAVDISAQNQTRSPRSTPTRTLAAMSRHELAAPEKRLARRTAAVLRSDAIRQQYDGWVKRRTLAKYLQVHEEMMVETIDSTEWGIRDNGVKYFETYTDGKGHVYVKACPSRQEQADLEVLAEADAAAGSQTPPPSPGNEEPAATSEEKAPSPAAEEAEVLEDSWGAPWPGAAGLHRLMGQTVTATSGLGTHSEEVEELRTELARERTLREEMHHELKQERDLRERMQERSESQAQAENEAAETRQAAVDLMLQEILEHREKLDRILVDQAELQQAPASSGEAWVPDRRGPMTGPRLSCPMTGPNLMGPSPMTGPNDYDQMGPSPMTGPNLNQMGPCPMTGPKFNQMGPSPMMGRSPMGPPLPRPPSLDSILAFEAAAWHRRRAQEHRRAMEEVLEADNIARFGTMHTRRQLEESDAIEAELAKRPRNSMGPSPGMPPPGPIPHWHASSNWSWTWMGPSPGMLSSAGPLPGCSASGWPEPPASHPPPYWLRPPPHWH